MSQELESTGVLSEVADQHKAAVVFIYTNRKKEKGLIKQTSK